MTEKVAQQPTKAGTPRVGWLVVGIVFLLIGGGWWTSYVRLTGTGFKTGSLDTPYVVLLFLYWLVPWLIGTITVLVASARQRKVASLIVLPLSLILLAVAIVATVAGAEPTPTGPGIH